MDSTWIEAPAHGRHGGPVRAGMWSTVVVGTHPIEADQGVWLELSADDAALGLLPAYWLENKGVNSLWHVPIPPQRVGTRLRYRAVARRGDQDLSGPRQEVTVRPNLPERSESGELVASRAEGLIGNRMMAARVDGRGSTYDVFFPSVGMVSGVRPAEGDRPHSHSHFRAIVAGLALGRRLDWFAERLGWEAFQHYQGATNLLVTELSWRRGPVRVLATDFAAMGADLPRSNQGTESHGQYLKRYRITNHGHSPIKATFGVYVQAEVNGGIGETGLAWHDGERALLASNRGHGHTNRKLARDATIEFAVALDDRGPVACEPTGPAEAMLLRPLELPAGETVTVDLLVSGAFTGWRGDDGTFESWLRPALEWFRRADLDAVEQATAAQWDAYVEPLPVLAAPAAGYAVALRRSALALALHADARWGAVAAGLDRGIHAYCWPRDAIGAAGAFERIGHPRLAGNVLDWLGRVRAHSRAYGFWFQKYTIDGKPEWESPSIDQSALVPWAVERHYRSTGDLDAVESAWPMVEQACSACEGTNHPGLRFLDDLDLISSAGLWDTRYAAFLYGNACAVAGLRAGSRLAEALGRHGDQADRWRTLADRIWTRGILAEAPAEGEGPGLVDAATGRFLEARRLSTVRGLWSDDPEFLIDRSRAIDAAATALAVPLGLLPASDPRLRRSAEAILRACALPRDPHGLACWAPDPDREPLGPGSGNGEAAARHDLSALATLGLARYLIALGRETGEPGPWSRAAAMLDALIRRLGPLGVALRADGRRADDHGGAARSQQGAWGVHALLIETLLDLAGLGYDAPEARIALAPALPPAWPQVGLDRSLACGEVSYRLSRRPGSQSYRLGFEARLDRPVRLLLNLTCPGLADLGPWSGPDGDAAGSPRFDRRSRRLSWAVDLPAGPSKLAWAWGYEEAPIGSGV